MKITITVELDQEAAQMIANPLESISQKITKLIESFEINSPAIKSTPENPVAPPIEIEEEPIQEPAQTQEEPVNSISDKKSIKETILETIKSKKGGVKAKDIREITGFTGKQISNNIFHLKKEKLVKKTVKGFFVYIPPKKPSIKSDLESE